jgi:hypothetical protein
MEVVSGDKVAEEEAGTADLLPFNGAGKAAARPQGICSSIRQLH